MSAIERPLALTLGDPAGIGPDIALLAWQARSSEPVPPFLLLGDPKILDVRARQLGLIAPVQTIGDAGETSALFDRALPVLPISDLGQVEAGRPTVEAADAVQRAIESAVDLVKQDKARAVVTNPISKATLYRAGFPFAGHTEFLHALSKNWGEARAPVMLLASAPLNVVPATVHVPLSEVPRLLSPELIASTIETTALGLQRYFGVSSPRISVAGLNPHAGEDGTLGREEIDIIAPAIETARAKGFDVNGPFPADTLFHTQARSTYDVVIGMYHDQVLVPFKTLAFDTGVNVTLGLPFIRTSPDHGTAFALAGTGRASPRSLIEALRLADRMSRRAGAEG
jgi:4-hydroxythreonine-4-phosphate dehydrogenase